MPGPEKYDWPSDKELAALVLRMGQQAAADSLGIPRPTLQSRLKRRGIKTQRQGQQVAPVDDPQRVRITQLEAELKALRRENKHYSEALADQEQFFTQIIEETRVAVKKPKIAPKPPKRKSHHLSVILPIFDQQFGQFVRPSDTPGGKGNYSEAVFDKRLARWVEAAKGIMRDKATAYALDELIVPFGGDHVEGDEIFPGQSWQLEVDPVRQVWMLAEKMEPAIRSVVRYAKRDLGVKKVACYGVDDNHGKVGGKRSGARPKTYSWNYLFLRLLFDKLREEPVDQFAIEPGGSLFFRAADHEFQLIHGHQVRGWGGLPFYGLAKFDGRSMRLHNRIYRYLLMGHHHQPAKIPNGAGEIFVSGDWVGANNLSGDMTAASRPQQSVLFASKKWGITCEENIYFEDAHAAYEPTHIYEP